jgi:hypothetical protein
MAIFDDWTIDPVTRRVTHTSGTTVYTCNALYSWLESQFATAGYMQYSVPMSASTPVNYTMVNGWFLDEASLQYLRLGGISTSGWSSAIYVLTFGSTYTAAVSSDIGKTVTAGVATGTLLAYDNTAKLWWVRAGTGTLAAGATSITSGTGAGTTTAVATGEAVFSNLYTLGTLQSGTQLYVSQGANTVITSYWPSGHIDLLLTVKRAGVAINSGLAAVYAREFGNTYAYYSIDLSTGGRNPVPLQTAADASIVDSAATVGAFTGISLSFGAVSKNLGNGNGAKNYDLVVTCGGNRMYQVYEYLQYIARRGAAGLLNGVQGQLYLALSSYTANTAAPFGSFAGGKFFGAQGVWVEGMDSRDVQAFQLIASDGSTQIPPNTVTVAVTGVVSGDQVLVARSTGAGSTTINLSQYALAISGNESGSGTVTVSGSIGADEPQAGTIRVLNASGTYDRYVYSSWSRSTFTLNATSHPNGLTANYNGKAAFVPLLDAAASGTSLSTTLIYAADIPIVVRVRRYIASGGSILPFESVGTVGSAGASVAAIRTLDTVAA